MRRSLVVSLICVGLALVSIPLAWMRVEDEKEDVVITEEALSGDPAAARGVSLRIASHWDGHLLWDTEYTIGSGKGAESEFSFAGEQVAWEWEPHPTAKAEFPGLYGGTYAASLWEEEVSADSMMPYPEIVQAVATGTLEGETLQETVRLGDYREYHPVDFALEGISVEYEGDYARTLSYLTELFRIPVAEDRIRVTVEKDSAGDFISCKEERTEDAQSIRIAGGSAFGKAGVYYAFCLENMETGKAAHRGENCGLFWLPFEEERDGWIQVDLTRMEKVCPLPEGTVPEGLLLEEGKGRLYVAAKEGQDYSLLVYDLGSGAPVLAQRVALGQERLFRAEGMTGNSLYLEGTDTELVLASPGFCAMSREDGGLLLTWNDNGFSFVTETDGECRLWCSGQFPEQPEEEYIGTGHGWMANHLFPMERECLFDGERLVLAAFEDWDSLNVLLAVYDRDGESYSGLYRYGGDNSGYFSGETYKAGVHAQGRDSLSFLEERILSDVHVRGSGEEMKALELRGGEK